MLLVVNFKSYKKGKEVLELAKLIQKYDKKAIVGIPEKNIEEVKKKTKVKVFSQKDVNSGFVDGTFLNHSDHRISFSVLKKKVADYKKRKKKVLVFVKNISDAKKVKTLKPWAIAYEDPKLIGSGKSITEYRTKEVKDFAKLFKDSKIIPICGAGISDGKDVAKARALGCKGVVVASAIARGSLKKAESFLQS